MGAQEDPDHGGFLFKNVEAAKKAAEAIGQKINVLDALLKRKAKLKTHKDGRLVMHITKKPGEKERPLKGWISKADKWVKMFDVFADEKNADVSYAEYDNIIRQVVSPSKEDAGWYLRASDGSWHRYSTEKVKLRLLSLGNTKPEAELILGSTIGKAWKLVNVPFQNEYPGDRQWNVDAAQYAYPPVNLDYEETPQHPHWDRVLKHCGQDLDGAVRDDEWCKLHSIKSGADYLLYWIAYLLRDPFQPLPYLFLYGNQNSGKSILHQAFRLLITKGAASADRALTNNNDFNGELANCVLAYIEETDLSANGGRPYYRIKDWTTNDELWIRRMRTDAYKQRNTLHFVQTGNKLCHIYMESGDTRIVVIHVLDLEPGEEIPKNVLIARLKEEAPHFMRTIMDLTLPSAYSRLGLPPLRTKNKERAEAINRDALEAFLQEQCFKVNGELTEFSEFYKRFLDWLPEDRRDFWQKNIVIDEVKQRFPYGGYTGNKRMIGNLSLIPKTVDSKPWVSIDNWLVRKEDE
ncbi:MAG TPA: primase-helicase family protein [Thermoguttaceae bacterium]